MAVVRFTASLLSRRATSAAPLILRRSYAEGGLMPLTFSSPTKAFYDNTNVKQVDVSTTTGMFGILPYHVPAIAVLKPGLLTVYEEDKQNKYFVSSGSVTIHADSSVQILAEEAYTLDQLDPQAARQGLEQSQQQAASASTDETRAEAQIGVELYEALVKALES